MKYRQIMVPLDGSLLAEYILPHVEAMAKAFLSQVILTHVIPTDDTAEDELTPSQRQARAHISDYLARTAEALADKGLEVRWVLRVGDPVQSLMEYVTSQGIDLVIMATHGQGESYQRKVGSVAAALLDNVSVPLVLVRVPQSIARL
jgi:nucleotide-binding universal stress UspA family protein